MANHYLFNVFNHLQPIRAWAKARDARMNLSADTFELTLHLAAHSVTLLPRFMVKLGNGHSAYTSVFSSACRLVGWLPYQIKRWPEASDKLVFKDCCAGHGLRVPDHWHNGPPETADYIVKPRAGSWGRGIRGPFRAAREPAIAVANVPQGDLPENLPEPLQSGDYFEQFIPGRPAKIWFWNATPVAMECADLPTVIGDGRRSLARIVAETRGNFDLSFDIASSRTMLAWQGVTADTVAPAGASYLLDFLYASAFDRIILESRECLPQQSPARRSELEHVGRCLFDSIPADLRVHTLFTLDAVIDHRDRLWLLEMNSHTVIHPRAYRAMLDDLFNMMPEGSSDGSSDGSPEGSPPQPSGSRDN